MSSIMNKAENKLTMCEMLLSDDNFDMNEEVGVLLHDVVVLVYLHLVPRCEYDFHRINLSESVQKLPYGIRPEKCYQWLTDNSEMMDTWRYYYMDSNKVPAIDDLIEALGNVRELVLCASKSQEVQARNKSSQDIFSEDIVKRVERILNKYDFIASAHDILKMMPPHVPTMNDDMLEDSVKRAYAMSFD